MKVIERPKTNIRFGSDVYVEKPPVPHIMESQTELTEQELARRRFAEKQLSELGISITSFDTRDDGHENPYILEAIIIASKGEEIPEDLKEKIKELKENVE